MQTRKAGVCGTLRRGGGVGKRTWLGCCSRRRRGPVRVRLGGGGQKRHASGRINFSAFARTGMRRRANCVSFEGVSNLRGGCQQGRVGILRLQGGAGFWMQFEIVGNSAVMPIESAGSYSEEAHKGTRACSGARGYFGLAGCCIAILRKDGDAKTIHFCGLPVDRVETRGARRSANRHTCSRGK